MISTRWRGYPHTNVAHPSFTKRAVAKRKLTTGTTFTSESGHRTHTDLWPRLVPLFGSDIVQNFRVGLVRALFRILKEPQVTEAMTQSTISSAYLRSLRTIGMENWRNALMTVHCPFEEDTHDVPG